MTDVLGAVATVVDLIGTVRDLVNAEKGNWERYKDLPVDFEKFLRELDICNVQLNGFKRSYKSAASELSDELKQRYVTLITSQKEKLDEIKAYYEDLISEISESSTSSEKWKWVKTRATNRTKVVNASETIKMTSEFVADLRQLLKECHDELKSLKEKRGDQFTPHFHSSKLENIILEMNDERTGEGQLKQGVMAGGNATDLSGSSPRIEGSSSGNGGTTSVEGMSGIGKTKALEGLANDEEVKEKFKDGVFFMKFGKEADDKMLKDNLCMILRQSGGKKLYKRIVNNSKQTVTKATSGWFKDKKALFICDDLWPTASNPLGYLTEIETLRDCSSTCHLVISTQCVEIASQACKKSGAAVTFKLLDITGRKAKDVLLKYADVSDTEFESLSDNEKSIVEEILKKCGGLYLALTAAGGFLLNSKEDCSLPVAVRSICSALSKEEKGLLDENVKERYKPLYRCFEESLERINEWADMHGLGDFWSNTIPRLCVYQKNTKLTKEMMKYVWLVESYEGRLVEKLRNFHLLEVEKDAELYTFHDLFHDFCIRKAGGEGEVPRLHRGFLDHVAKRCGVSNLGQSSTERVRGRLWWKLPDGGGIEMYMRSNLARHLKEAGKVDELEALMVRFEWTLFRFKKKEYNEMMNDLSIWVKEGEKKWREGVEDRNLYIRKRQMGQAIISAWLRSENEKELACQVLGHLLDSREISIFAKLYIDSVERVGMKGWLRPSQQFWKAFSENALGVQFPVSEILVDWDKDEAIAFGADGEMALLDLSTLTVNLLNEDRNREVTCAARSKNGKTVILGSKEGKIVEWDEQSRQTVRRICNVGGYVSSVALSDDGSFVAFSYRDAFSSDAIVCVWNVEKREELIVLKGHKDAVSCVAINGDGCCVVSGSDDETVRVWDVEKGEEICVHDGHEAAVVSVTVNRSGNRVASCAKDSSLHVWDVEKKEVFCVFKSNSYPFLVAMNGDGSRVVSVERSTVHVWDVDKRKALCVFKVHNGWVSSVAMNGEGTRIVSGSEDKTVGVWDVEKEETLCAYEGHMSSKQILAISGEGNRSLVYNYNTVRVWDAVKRETLWEHEFKDSERKRILMCKNGSRITFFSRNDDSVHVWNVEKGQELCKLECQNGATGNVIMSGNGNRVLFSSDEIVCVWDVGKKEKIFQLKVDTVGLRALTMSGDGNRVAIRSYKHSFYIWDVEKGEMLCELKGHMRGIKSIAMNDDGSRVVSGSADMTVRVWNVEKGKEMCQLQGDWGKMYAVIISADGCCFAYRLRDGTLLIYKVMDNGHTLLHQNYKLVHKLRLPTCCVGFNGQQIVIGLAGGRVIKFDKVE